MFAFVRTILKLAHKCAILTLLISGCTLGLFSFLWGLNTTGRHTYSFTVFSIRLVSFAYFTTSVGLLTATLLGLTLDGKSNNSNKSFLIFNACLFMTVVLLLVVGSFGLISISSKHIDASVQAEMRYTFHTYDEKRGDQTETRSFNWLHRKFNCCGINSYVKYN